MKSRPWAVFLLAPSPHSDLSDSAMPRLRFHLFKQRRHFELHCSRLFLLKEQSTAVPHAGEHSGAKMDKISAFGATSSRFRES
jgi:hypothetical protein